MWRKILTLFLFFLLNLAADEIKIEQVQLLADDVKQENGVVLADKNVVLYSQTYLITADKAVYDQNSSIIELFGNVNMMRGLNEISRSNYAKLNLKNKDSSFEALFMMDKDIGVWMRSDESSSDSEYYRTNKIIVSSCNVQDPDWSISASSAMLNKNSKFLHMFNPVFRIGSVPVFYLPYFGFSTDTTRRTGLLPPEVGHDKDEGIYYKQPLYFAPYNQWDFEIDPQIRTRRGAGVYSTFRFVDSPDSKGEVSFGFFKDRQAYRQRQSRKSSNNQHLKNKDHQGIELKYERDKLIKYLTEGDLQEGLWLDAINLNDIEYLNLRGRDDDFDSLVTSRLNYFIADDKNYFGAYAKYYIDTEKIGSQNSNKDTLQELPSLQYHKFSDTFILPNLIYSADLQAHRYTRKIGVRATQYEFSLPVSLHIPLFDDLATLSFDEYFYASRIDYEKKAISQSDKNKDKHDNYIDNYHKISLHTDLAKAYENFFHTINFGSEYLVPGLNRGDLDDDFIYDLNGNQYENFLKQTTRKQEFLAYATQYLYNNDGRKILRHTISQGYYTKDSEYSNLNNIIAFYPLPNLSFYNKSEYSHKDNRFEKIQSGINYSNDLFSGNILHTMKRNLNAQKDSYLSTYASINLPHQYRIKGGWQYDLERDYTKTWHFGIIHHRKCWNYALTYKRDIEPITTTTGSATRVSRGVLFSISFYPMGGANYDFSVSQEQSR